MDLSHGGDCRLASTPGNPLLDRHAWWQAFDPVDIGLLELLDELTGIRRHAVKEPALSLCEEDVER